MTQTDRRAPDFRISIGRAPLAEGLSQRVREIVVRRHQDRLDSFMVRLADPEEDLFDRDALAFGDAVSIQLGYVGALEEVCQGEITAQRVERGLQGSSFVFRGLDRSHRLARGASHGVFSEVRGGDLAATLGRRSGLKPEAPGAWPGEGTVHQLGLSDRALLRERAARVGRRLIPRGGTLEIATQAYGEAARSLAWEGDLSAADLVVDLASQVEEVRVRGWAPGTHGAIDERISASDLGWPKGDGDLGALRASRLFGAGAALIPDAGPGDSAEAKAIGLAHLAGRCEAFITGPVTLAGAPDLEPGLLLDLTGLGEVMSGRYLIHGVTHFYSGAGFTTRLELGRAAA